jgi:hypothetical protein
MKIIYFRKYYTDYIRHGVRNQEDGGDDFFLVIQGLVYVAYD